MVIAAAAIVAITAHLVLKFAINQPATIHLLPLWLALAIGGTPLVWELAVKAMRGEFGSDLLAGISIVTASLLGEYLAGTLVVLMLSGGAALEHYALFSASSVLQALAKRVPAIAHRQRGGTVCDIPLTEIDIGDSLLVLPHEICPVDGIVQSGHGAMDESYLTGEPYNMSKTPGSAVLSGAINGSAALTIKATKRAADSRYAQIMQVMQQSQQYRPTMRRLGDQLGAVYTPLAVSIGLVAWWFTGDVIRFLAVLVVATPCPLLIAIPVAIIGSVSLAARRGIIIKTPVVLEQVDSCKTLIFDKTGTLTYGKPRLIEQVTAEGMSPREILTLTASLERYSRHPLATAVMAAAEEAGIALREVTEIGEDPGEGLRGTVDGRCIQVTSRKKLAAQLPEAIRRLPPPVGGLECVVVIDQDYAATFRFRDQPRSEGLSFVNHLHPRHRKHHFERVMIVSGDRQAEVDYLAEQVGIRIVHAEQSPEDKLRIVREETRLAKTLYLGDGINDAPALMAASVGVAFGQNSDVTSEAADAVVLDSELSKVDELLHIGGRMRRIALQSAVGGMGLSVLGMGLAAGGYLTPVAGAVAQELIDVLAVLNALRAAMPPTSLTDFSTMDETRPGN